MAIVEVEVPDGEFCNHCEYRDKGTVWCNIFEDYLKENDDNTNYYKCRNCPKE